MLEFRKDLFSAERDDSLQIVGKGSATAGHARPCHRPLALLRRPCLRGASASQGGAQPPHHHARIRRIDTAEAERASGVKRILKGADVPVNKNTLLSLINFGKDDEPTLAVDKVRYLGEPIVAIIAETEAQALALASSFASNTRLCPPSSTSRSAEARCAGDQ